MLVVTSGLPSTIVAPPQFKVNVKMANFETINNVNGENFIVKMTITGIYNSKAESTSENAILLTTAPITSSCTIAILGSTVVL